jgi:hypothetical protein
VSAGKSERLHRLQHPRQTVSQSRIENCLVGRMARPRSPQPCATLLLTDIANVLAHSLWPYGRSLFMVTTVPMKRAESGARYLEPTSDAVRNVLLTDLYSLF